MYVDDVTVLVATGCLTPTSTVTGTPPTATPTGTLPPAPNVCPGPVNIHGAITSSDPAQPTQRLFRDGQASACGDGDTCDAPIAGGPFHYDAYTLNNNTAVQQCVTVAVNTACTGTNAIFVGAYLGTFDPNSVCTNWIGDLGWSPEPARSFTAQVPAGQNLAVVVSAVTANTGCPGYDLTISADACPAATDTPTPTATSTPTATGTLSPTPTSTETPTPTATACYAPNPLQNPGFESGSFAPGWIAQNQTPPPAIVTDTVHGGQYAALLGSLGTPEPDGDSSIYQQFNVPAAGGTLSFWYWPYTTDTVYWDWQEVLVMDPGGTNVTTVLHVAENDRTWKHVTFDLAPYAGQSVLVVFLVHQDGYGDETAMLVDDVAVLTPGACGTATPTVTGTPPTSTPTPTLPPLPYEVRLPVCFFNASQP
jgi:hypothetical protein